MMQNRNALTMNQPRLCWLTSRKGLSFHILEASSWESPITTHPSLFNLAKLTYHKSQVSTHDQFLEKVGENQHVSAYPVTADDMKDCFSTYSTVISRGETLKWQVFLADTGRSSPIEMTLATSTLPDAKTQLPEMKKKTLKNREQRFDDELNVDGGCISFRINHAYHGVVRYV